MEKYSVKKLSELAGISVRTLHYYDQIGLLKPSIRTEARYRFYGSEELFRLQQILFYKELDFPLEKIHEILDDPDFDLMLALSNHKTALKEKRDRIDILIDTIDKTINNQFKNDKTMLKPEELYEGLSKETADSYRKEAIKKYGKKTVETSEKSLQQLTKEQFAALRQEQQDITAELFALVNEDYTSAEVQAVIARHYANTRKFWGTYDSSDTQSEQYAGLGDLYINDERFTMIDGKAQPAFAQFLSKAMGYFANNNLS